MRPAKRPSPAVMRRRAGKGSGAKIAVIPSIRDLVELLSGIKVGMLFVVLYACTDKGYGLV